MLFFLAVAKLYGCVLVDLHTEAVQAALAKYKERKMPMPSKRRSVLVQSSVEACTPPGKTSHSPPRAHRKLSRYTVCILWIVYMCGVVWNTDTPVSPV